jgi:excisionase family DNA binding protein
MVAEVINMAELLKIPEAAKRMHVSRETIYAWIRDGKMKVFKTPGGRYRIPEDELIIPAPQAQAVDPENKGE